MSENRPEDFLWRRMILLGAGGPVKRAEAEASQMREQIKRLTEAGATPVTESDKAARKEKQRKKL